MVHNNAMDQYVTWAVGVFRKTDENVHSAEVGGPDIFQTYFQVYF
jgi:hypothetical protein